MRNRKDARDPAVRAEDDLPLARSTACPRIPLWIKLAYSLFAAVFVVVEARSSPLLFLWFCNIAVLITLAGLWLESSLLLSMELLAIVWPHLFWQLDCLVRLTLGRRLFESCGIAPAGYMFEPGFPRWNWFISLQHAWMLYLLLWAVWRLGYDRRALGAQTFVAWVVLPLSYALVRDIHGPAGNVNSVLGLSGSQPQTHFAPWLWLVVLMVLLPLLHYGPAHFIFRLVFRPLVRADTSLARPARVERHTLR